jgi:hypothetical protein
VPRLESARVDAVAARPTEDAAAALPGGDQVGGTGVSEAVASVPSEEIVTLPPACLHIITGSPSERAPAIPWRAQAVISSTTRRDDAIVGERGAGRRNDRVAARATACDQEGARASQGDVES